MTSAGANISAYNHGMMGYKTPNIDRIAKEGALFTDAYAQQSCTAGRSSFILGEHPFRTGLLTIGMPGSPQGIPDWAPDSTWSEPMKDQTCSRRPAGDAGFKERKRTSPRIASLFPQLPPVHIQERLDSHRHEE
jgi:hypothetical protein